MRWGEVSFLQTLVPPSPSPFQAANGDVETAAELFLAGGAGDVGAPVPPGGAAPVDRDEALARSLANLPGPAAVG
jgi:hypothetical protein